MSWSSGGLRCLVLILVCPFRVPGASFPSWEETERVSVTNNVAYKGITIAFPAEIKNVDAKNLIDNAKLLLKEASKSLHEATGRLASFAEIYFLIPNSWTGFEPVEFASGQTYETATFRVASTDQEFQFASAKPEPLTVQYSGCGKKGKYIIVPKLYFRNIPPPGEERVKYARRLSREWARYRYGVFDERGYEGHPLYPLFYSIPGEGNNTILLNSCTNVKLNVREKNNEGTECSVSVNETTGLPVDDSCYLEPFFDGQNEHIRSSLMFSSDLPMGDLFCGSDQTIHHNQTSPNMQNAFCEGKSVREVIRASPDFSPSPSPSEIPMEPTFKYIKEPPFQLAVALDIGHRMMYSMENIKNLLTLFFEKDIPSNTVVHLGSFGSNGCDEFFNETISNAQSLLNKIQSVNSNDRSDSCLSCAIQQLRQHTSHPLTVMAVTDGNMNQSLQTSLKSVLKNNTQMKLHLIIYPDTALLDQSLTESILSNGGDIIYVKNKIPALIVTSLGEAFRSVLGKHALRNEITTAIFGGDEIGVKKTAYFSLDQIEHVENLTVCLYQTKRLDNPVKKETLNFTLGDKNYDYKDSPPFKKEENIGDKCVSFCFSFSKGELERNSDGALSFTIEQVTDDVVVKAWTTLTSETKLNPSFIAESINLNAWVEWHNEETEDAVIIYAELKQGHRPIKGAEVKATISLPADDQLRDGDISEVILYDNGNGDPDIREGDGLYSRYFSKFRKIGSYVVSVFAIGQQGRAKVIESFPIQDFSRNGVKWKTIDAFSRATHVAATFHVSKLRDSVDRIHPNRILDLRVLKAVDRRVDLQWTAPGNNFDDDILAYEYSIKYFVALDDAVNRFDETGSLVSEWDKPGKPLSPEKYGTEQTITVNLPITDHGGYLYFAMKTSDESNNTSPVSNVIAVYLTTLADMISSTSEPNGTTDSPDSYMGAGGLTNTEIGLIVGFVLIGVILIVVIIIVVIYVRRKNKKKIEEPETFISIRTRNNASAFTSNNNGTTKLPSETNRNGPSVVPIEPVNPARLSVSSGGPLQSWPAETLLNHFEKVQEAKQRNQPRPILNVGDLLESLSESNSSVASVSPVQQNGIYTSIRRENGFTPQRPAPPRPSSQLSSHSKQVTQV